jgi:hypothetical protein
MFFYVFFLIAATIAAVDGLKRGARSRGLFIAAPFALMLGGCIAAPVEAVDGGAGGGVTTTTTTDTATTSAGLCHAFSVCPDGAYDQCEFGDYMVPCCSGGNVYSVCARPAGILVHDPMCKAACLAAGSDSTLCAVSVKGWLTCCQFNADGGAGACDSSQ